MALRIGAPNDLNWQNKPPASLAGRDQMHGLAAIHPNGVIGFWVKAPGADKFAGVRVCLGLMGSGCL